MWESIISYNRLDIVTHNNKEWIALENNTDVEPGTDNLIWDSYTPEYTGSYEPYDATRRYSSGDKVAFNERTWESVRNNNRNITPGTDTSRWIQFLDPLLTPHPEDYDEWGYSYWKQDKVYNSGDIVAYDGRHWTAQWYTSGDVPGSAQVWVQYIDPNIPPNPDDFDEWGNPKWNSWTVYNTGDIVSHDNKLWIANYYSYNNEPGTSGHWDRYYDPILIPPDPEEDEDFDFELGAYHWDPDVLYEVGFKVSHDAQLWICVQNTYAGAEPGVSNRWELYDPQEDPDPDVFNWVDDKIWVDAYIWREE